MRRCLAILAFLGACALAFAQNDDEVMGGTGDLQFESSVPVAGSAALNRLTGVSLYGAPYSRYFVEGVVAMGDGRFGIGANLGYLPERWGGYMSAIYMYKSSIVTAGAIVRPVVRKAPVDWQLYGGLAVSHSVGYEVGMRFGANAEANNGAFSWLSGSLGHLHVNKANFVTIGMSIDIIAFMSLFLLL